MDLRQIAKGAPYNLALKIEECSLWRFWVVLLDNGMEVYQTADDPSLDEPNPWMRLKLFCQDHQRKIVSMAFARKDFDPVAQINLTPQADGYFYSRRIRRMLAANRSVGGFMDEAQGFGELHGNQLTIHWVDVNSGRVTTEKRDIQMHHKKGSGALSLIRAS